MPILMSAQKMKELVSSETTMAILAEDMHFVFSITWFLVNTHASQLCMIQITQLILGGRILQSQLISTVSLVGRMVEMVLLLRKSVMSASITLRLLTIS
jgi:hypothetical protein